MRTPSGTFETHLSDEVTSLARLLTLTRRDGVRTLLTDHDADITVADRNAKAEATLTVDTNAEGAKKAIGTLSLDAVPGGPAAAQGTLTATGNAVDAETVTIDAKTYTFQTTLTDVDGNVLIGATAGDSIANLAAAINLDAGAGTKYAASTTAHLTVSATDNLDTTMTATAKEEGAAGNAIGTSDTMAAASWGGATLAGGLDAHENVQDAETVTIDLKTYTFQTTLTDTDGNVQIGADADESLANLVAAINLDAGAGTRYAASTTLHPTVYAVAFGSVSADDELLDPAGGTPIGDMNNFNAATGFGGTPAAVFDGQNSKPAARSPASLHSAGLAWVGKDLSGSPKTVSRAIVYGTSNRGWWLDQAGSIISSLVMDLRSDSSLPVTGAEGTSLGANAPTINPVSFGALISPSREIVNTADPNALNAYVWVTLFDSTLDAAAAGSYIVSQVEFYTPLVVPVRGTIGVVANTEGLASNDISTSETLTAGSWGGATLTGGQDAVLNPLDSETVTIDGKTYTFQDTLTDVDGNVQTGTLAADSLANLVAAINLDAGSGVKYAASTLIHPSVSATDNLDGTITVTAKEAGVAANSKAISETLTRGSWGGAFLSGGLDGTFKSVPGFTASALLYSTGRAIAGVDVKIPENDFVFTQRDIDRQLYSNAPAVLEYVRWDSPDDGVMILFTGTVGHAIGNDDGLISVQIEGKFTRARRVNVEAYSPKCRADLGDSRCKFAIGLDRREFTVAASSSQSRFTTDLAQPDDFWNLGVMRFLTGDNAGIAIEVSGFANADGEITLFLPAPLTINPGDTGEIWPGCDKTLNTCRTRYDQVVNFRGEPFAPQESTLFAYEG